MNSGLSFKDGKLRMKAETQALADEIKQSIELLRRHL